MLEPDTLFDNLVIDWLGVNSMQETHAPDEFGTLLDIIYTGKMSDLARHAAYELLLHIYRSDDYAELLVLRDMPSHDVSEIADVLPGMQTKFARALLKCSVEGSPGKELWMPTMFPHAEEPQTAINSSPLQMLCNHLREVVNGGIPADDPLYDWNSLVAFAEQYKPTGRTKLHRNFREKLAIVKEMLEAQMAVA